MKYTLGPRQSLILIGAGKRLVNASDRHTIQVLVIDEPGCKVAIDHQSYPKTPPKHRQNTAKTPPKQPEQGQSGGISKA